MSVAHMKTCFKY